MRQEVNLLSADLLPPKEYLRVAQVPYLLGAWLAALLLVSGWDAVQQHRLGEQTVALEPLLAQARVRTEVLRSKYGEPAPPQQLQARIDALKASQQAKQQLLLQLRTGGTRHGGGLSDYFAALADASITGVWLTQLVVDRASATMQFAGGASAEGRVAEWLTALHAAPSFAGARFDGLQIGRAGAGTTTDQLTFAVNGMPQTLTATTAKAAAPTIAQANVEAHPSRPSSQALIDRAGPATPAAASPGP